MTGRILLVCGDDIGPMLASVLSGRNPDLEIGQAGCRADLEAYAGGLTGTRIIAFCTDVIVPSGLLTEAATPAYNIHPASPDYPGSHCASFAVYAGARSFGATAHEMVARVDEGPIVGVEEFEVPAGIGVIELEGMASAASGRLFWRLAPALADLSRPLPAIGRGWSGRKTTRREFREMGQIPPSIDAAEFERRWRAFGERDPSIMQVEIHGRQFRLAV